MLFYLFFIVPIFFLLFLSAEKVRKRRIQLFGSGIFQGKLKKNIHFVNRGLKAILILISFSLFIIALASPQTVSKLKVKKKLGSEFFFSLDTSLSMLAQDEVPNRLMRGKLEILELLERLEGYKVGLIVFAGTSFVQCPLTMDHSAIRYFLESVDTQSLPVAGTALKKVIENGRKSFDEEKGTRKYLILFTDGEDLEGEDPLPAAREASREGITIFSIGFGSPSGSLIPLYEKGVMTGYKKDGQGTTVVTRLNESLLTEISHAAQGRYYKSTQEEAELDAILEQIARHGKKETVEESVHQYESRFQFPLFLALLFLTAELVLSERKKFDAT